VAFHPAENYHQDYYFQNKTRNGYCQYVVEPKLKKLKLDH
jgi:peptide-methionine (S)-S-oxide reductase